MRTPYGVSDSSIHYLRENGVLLRKDAGDLCGFRQDIYKVTGPVPGYEKDQDCSFHIFRDKDNRVVFMYCIQMELPAEKQKEEIEKMKWGLINDLDPPDGEWIEFYIPKDLPHA